MDRRIRQVAAVLTLVLIAVAFSSGYIQGIADEDIANRTGSNPNERAINPFRIYQECRWERGAVLSIDNQVLAESVPAPAQGRKCRFQRRYPLGDLAAHVVGTWSLDGKTGLESVYNEDLVGKPPPPERLSDYFANRDRIGNNLVATIDTRLQRAALDALAGRRGGVVALNPKSGAVLVAASNPSYDPNPLASNDLAQVRTARCALGVQIPGKTCKNPNSPLVSVALQARRPPGSSFKVVTAAAALESGRFTPSSTMAGGRSYKAPGDSREIHNFGGGSCGGNMQHALQVSCNVSFAKLAVDVGADQFAATAHAMGLEQFGGDAFAGCDARAISDIIESRTGCLPDEFQTSQLTEKLSRAGFRARAGFGQWRIQVSPFGMAVVAATVANGGFVPRPRFADRVIDPKGTTVRDIRTALGPSAMDSGNASKLTAMMRSVVSGGTGAFAFRGFPVAVAGKTGTAQQPTCSPDERAIFGRDCSDLPHAWFIAFAPASDPTLAIAVLVERGGGNNEEATGGRVAAPVARQVLQSYFQLYPTAEGAR